MAGGNAGRRRTLEALCMFALAACAPPMPDRMENGKALLDQLPDELPRGRTRLAALLLLTPDSLAMYDSTRIAYIDTPHRMAYFSRHEWAATPSQMLQPLLLRMLERAHYFSAVLTPPYAGPYAYALQTRVQELVQDFTSDPPMLRLTLHAQLNDGVSNRLLGAQEMAVRKAMRDRTPLAGVEAANLALAEALHGIAAFLLEATR